MSDEIMKQGPADEDDEHKDDLPPQVVEIDLYIDDDDDDDVLRGPESWREIGDTIADPIEPG